MKKEFLLILFLALSSNVLLGQDLRYDTIRYARGHYEKRVASFKIEPLVKGRTVFLGNSITEFGDWKKLLNDSTVINRGVAGDNTFGVLERLGEVILRKPSALFIEIGINDISQNIPSARIAKNIFLIAGSVKKELPQTSLYVISVLPTNDNVKHDYPEAFRKNHLVRELNQLLLQGAKDNQFMFIDLAKLFSDGDGNLSTRFAVDDGLHLNAEGYKAWVSFLKQRGILK